MIKSMRFLGKYYGCLMLAMVGVWAVILLGIWLNGNIDNTFGSYYRMLPMMTGVFVCVSQMNVSAYQNVALGMNAGRRELFWANQGLQLLMTVLFTLLSAAVWSGGKVLLPQGEEIPSLWLLPLAAAGSLMLGELGLLVGHISSRVAKAIMVAICIFVLTAFTFVTMLAGTVWSREQISRGDFLTYGVVLAGIAVVWLVLAAVEYRIIKRVVVK